MSTPEGKVKAKVNRALALLTGVYRFCPVQNGMGAPALDYYCCINGYFVAIETKVPGKDMTERQKMTARNIESAGGLCYTIHDNYDLLDMMADLVVRGIIPKNPML